MRGQRPTWPYTPPNINATKLPKKDYYGEEKSVHDHHRKKVFWGTFLASKKNSPGRWWIQKPYENQGSHIYHRNLSSVAPIFPAKKSSALVEGHDRPTSLYCILNYNAVKMPLGWWKDTIHLVEGYDLPGGRI